MVTDAISDRAGTKWDRAARYMKIVSVLHGHGERGISAVDLAKQIGVSKRTIYRDLKGMERDAGVTLWSDEGRYGIDEGTFLPPLDLTLPEAMAFFLAARLLTKATDELDTEIIGAFVKLAGILPDVLAEQLQETAAVFADTPSDEDFTRVLRSLTQALAGHRIVEIEYEAGVYDPAKGVRRARVHPYAIEPSAATRALYLIGYDEEREARRTYKVERIRSVSMTPMSFPGQAAAVAAEMRAAWDIVGDDTPADLVIRFDGAVAARVAETRWHPSQVLEPQGDGSLIWRARVAGLLEVRSWVLGWGAQAEVIEPRELREWVIEQLSGAMDRYSD